MTSGSEQLVTVVIPAFNAEMTIDETLRSARSQTHRAIEIVVVDDGSRDRTADIVAKHAAQDSRLRLVRQANAGVAAARNHGIALASAELIAPLDADDLWEQSKLERQLAALEAGGPNVALVYCWSAQIDEYSRIVDLSFRPRDEGDVLARMCRGNLAGNASSVLLRKDAVLEVGGYDPTLREKKAQGCEDLLLYYRIAARYSAALVPEFLTGYRMTARNMSSDVRQMLRSWQLVAGEMRTDHPELEKHIRAGEHFAVGWLLRQAFASGCRYEAARLGADVARTAPWTTLPRIAVDYAMSAIRRTKYQVRRGPVQTPNEAATRFEIGAVGDE